MATPSQRRRAGGSYYGQEAPSDMRVRMPVRRPLLDSRVAAEIERQDSVVAGPYGRDRDGMRLALACMEDELHETIDAFQADKRPIEGRTWSGTKKELIQTIAIGLRLLRDQS